MQLLNGDCVTYKILLRDAFVDRLSATEEGRKYLESAWILKQTAPDKSSLREYFKGGNYLWQFAKPSLLR